MATAVEGSSDMPDLEGAPGQAAAASPPPTEGATAPAVPEEATPTAVEVPVR